MFENYTVNSKLSNLKIWSQVCSKLGLEYRFYNEDKTLLGFDFFNQKYFFCNFATPFNTDSLSKLAADKEYCHLIYKDKVRTPKTKAYLDPYSRSFNYFSKYISYKDIASDILDNFDFPLILKPNSGSMGRNVFLVKNNSELTEKIESIFEQSSFAYDYILLAQDFITAKEEYRLIISKYFSEKLLLAYKKNNSGAIYVNNLSPLHWSGARADLVTDDLLLTSFKDYAQNFLKEINFGWLGLDILLDKENRIWFLEANSRPSLQIFCQNNNLNKLIPKFSITLSNFLDKHK